MPALCRGEGGPFSRPCLAGLASGNEGGPGADVEAIGRVNLGKRWSGSVCVGMPACLLREGWDTPGCPWVWGESLC